MAETDGGTSTLSHLDGAGRVRQVDVGDKPQTLREAEAHGFIRVSPTALRALLEERLAKGSPLEVARIAGIQAAKRTADLIPLCHQIPLHQVDIDVRVVDHGIALAAIVKARWHTGVEMEALTAVSVAALVVYDMLKAVDRTMTIGEIRLVRKSGGRSGDVATVDRGNESVAP